MSDRMKTLTRLQIFYFFDYKSKPIHIRFLIVGGKNANCTVRRFLNLNILIGKFNR